MSKKAGVVIDAYKLPVFKRHLDAAGLIYSEHKGPGPGMITLQVECDMVASMQPIIEAAEREARRHINGAVRK